MAIGLAVLAAANHLPEQTKEFLALLALAAVLGGALVFACLARLTVPLGASAHSRRIANIAIAAPIAWCVAFAAFVAFALSQM